MVQDGRVEVAAEDGFLAGLAVRLHPQQFPDVLLIRGLQAPVRGHDVRRFPLRCRRHGVSLCEARRSVNGAPGEFKRRPALGRYIAPYRIWLAVNAMPQAQRFQTVGLVGRTGSPHVVDSVVAVEAVLVRAGVEVVLESATADMLPGREHVTASRTDLGGRCDLIVVVGGDGSILGVARDLAHSGVLVVGVNRGGLGFLADVSPEQIEQKIAAVLDGAYTVEEHFLLERASNAMARPSNGPRRSTMSSCMRPRRPG